MHDFAPARLSQHPGEPVLFFNLPTGGLGPEFDIVCVGICYQVTRKPAKEPSSP